LHFGSTAVFKIFALAPVDNLTAPLWHCLELKKKQSERNVTGLGIGKVVLTCHQRTLRRHFRKQGTQRSEMRHSSCPVLFTLLENATKLNAYTCVSMRLERWTNVFVTSYIWCDRCTYDLFYCKVANVWKFESYNRIILSATNQQHHFLFTNPTESQKSWTMQLHLMYAVNFTRFEKHSWFSLRPAQQATHDNSLCFCKDWQCICPSRLQYTIYYKIKCWLFTLFLHFTFINIGLVVWNAKISRIV